MKRVCILCLAFLLVHLSGGADEPFRNHRYDTFKVLPVGANDIVFVGNSITNMHEWWEAFGGLPNIKNRGVSGAMTHEVLANIHAVAAGKPKKVFLMIGTNDLGNKGLNDPQRIAGNVARIIQSLQKETPRTRIYVQSILPSNVGLRTLQIGKQTNEAIEAVCREKGVTFIDLWDDLQGIPDGTHSLDHLHLKASGYQIWCKKIAPYVLDGEKGEPVYPEETSVLQQDGGLPGSYGMRCSYFSMWPVRRGDILMIGDEMIHGGEWHELLQSEKVKNRGTGWGYPGATMTQIQKEIDAILNSRSGSCLPAAVCLYAGAAEANQGKSAEEMLKEYQAIVQAIRAKAPGATIHLLSLLPTLMPEVNEEYVKPFNAALREYAATDERLHFIDLYQPLAVEDQARAPFFMGNYLSGMGYVEVARILAAPLGCKAL